MFDVTSIPCASSFILAKAPNFNRLPAFIKAGLIHYSKFQNVRSQKFHQRMIVCELLKAKANSLFLEAEIKEATLYYEQALSIYRYIMPKSLNTKPQNICDEDLEFIDFSSPKKEETIMIRELKVALYNNLAACYIKLKEYPNAISACNEVLLIDPNKTKALYRRAKALTLKGNAGLIEYRAANDDLKAAHKLDPKDQAVEQLYTKVKSELANIEKSQGIYVKDSGGPRDRRELDKPIQEEHKSKPKNVEEKKSSGNNNIKNKQQEKVVPTKKTEKVEIKQEKVIREKREEEKREETESTLHTESGEMEGKFDGNDVWKMLHGDIDPNSQDFSYSLSFEIDSKIKVPEEIQEFGRYIQKRGKEVMALYEKTGRKKEILTLKENLKNAINTHKRIENISRLNFSKPTARLRETAARLNLDLNDPSFQQELRKMQEKNLDDVRNWLKAAKVTPATNKKGNGNIGTRGSSSNSLGLLGFIIKLFSGNENKNSLITTVRSNESPNLKEALEKGVTQKELEALLNKGMTILKFVFWCIVILFALFVLIRSQNQEKQSKIGENPSL